MRIYLTIIILFVSFDLSAERPFVTEDAAISDLYQLEFDAWGVVRQSSRDVTAAQYLFVNVGLLDWLELGFISGSGIDFKNEDFVRSNSSINSKVLFWRPLDNGLPGFALSSGVNLRSGSGNSLRDDAFSSYVIAVFSSYLLDDKFKLHFNIGGRHVREKSISETTRLHWAIKSDLNIYNNLNFILEVFSGDTIRGRVPRATYQSGLVYTYSPSLKFNFSAGTQRESLPGLVERKKWEYWGQVGISILFDGFREL